MNTTDMKPTDPGSLSTAERLLLAPDLWDSVVADADAFPMTDAERHWIERRAADARDPATTWHSTADVLAFARRDRTA